MKKCVIIGSGLGGLSCGCILSKNGYDVVILEQGEQIGGCLQCFRRGDALFDTGMHYIGSADSGQVLHTMLSYLGVMGDICLSRLNPECYDIISFLGENYELANGRDRFVSTLSKHFPHCIHEIEKYYDLIKKVSSSWSYHSMKRDVDLNLNAEYQMLSVDEVLDSIFSDSILKQVIVGIAPLYAGVKGQTPFSTHALISDFYERSAFRIIGGSGKVADSLKKNINNMGGRIFLKERAVKIECNESCATGVITSSGNRYPADFVISAIHPAKAIQLIDSHLLRPIYRKRVANIQNTISAFTVYLKFKKNMVKYMNHNLFYYRNNTTMGCEKYDETTWPKFLLYMHFCHEKDPIYAKTGEIITYMNYDEVRQWEGTHTGHRGDEYNTFKTLKAEKIIDALEERVPGIRQSIECYYTSSPLTYHDYTNIPDGAMYGMAKNIHNYGSGNINCKTRIPNFYMTGQNITLHGMLGVLSGSFETCSEILSADEIFSQLEQYSGR